MSPQLASGPRLAGKPRLAQASGRRRAVAAPLVLALLLGVAAWQMADDLATSSSDGSILSYALEGPRGHVCLRLAIGMDVSGSMADFSHARDSALDQLQQWARRPNTLRADDEIAIVDFAFEAKTRLPPTPVADSSVTAQQPVDDGNATLVRPMLEAVAALPVSSPACDTVLILLSDAQVSDLPGTPAEGAEMLRNSGVHDVRLLVPGEAIEVPNVWTRAFPGAPPLRFDGLDGEETALTIGKTIAELTRQRLVPVAGPVS